MTHKKSDEEESNRCNDRVRESNDGLCLKNKAKSITNTSRNIGILTVEKTEITILHLSEKALDPIPLDDKDK